MIHCGRFFSNASVFVSSNRKAELRRSGPGPDRQRNTNEINRCQLHLQPGWRCTAARCLKQGGSKRQQKKDTDRDQYELTITPVSGVMGSHIALVLDGSPWSGEARILLMRLTFQCNQTAAAHKKSLRAWRISVAAAALQLSNSLKMSFYLICSWFTWRICFYRQEYFHFLPSQRLLERKCCFWMKALIIV